MKFNDILYAERVLEEYVQKNKTLNCNFDNENEWYYKYQDYKLEEKLDEIKDFLKNNHNLIII